MTTPDELIAILNRLLNGSGEEKDIEQFRNWSKTGDAQTLIQFVIQLGKYNTNIGEGQGIEIGDRLDTELLKEIRDLVRSQQASQSPARSSASVLDIDWHSISRNLLTKHRHLTTNQIVADRDMHRELDEMYVSLALMERRKPERQSEQARLWQDTSLSEPEYEEKQRFEHQQFLQDILRAGKGKSQGTRIAMIGEPGAGKTTLLCKIAFWLAKSSEDIPILISLADLQEQSLEDYLLQKWLKDALKVVRVMPQQEEALRSLFERGRVWLLLDGADEVTTGAYLRSPLQTIQSELMGWVGQARVILTCRLNLWDAIPNALLTQFEIYRTLPFSYGDGKTSDQVGEFITKWFKGEQLGQELRQALEQPGKERIKDLAKNPLRLALLCRTWHLWREQGGLPDTKAKLYQGFVDDFYNFYESRPNKSRVKKQQRRKLNEALGKLAKWALDRPTARFRLRLSQIPEPLAQILGDEDEEGSLLWWLVSELSWLVNIGDSAESPGDAVYTFFHPTFQEYFAALAIDDWHFFLNHIPENPNHPDASYRIFEPQWKEVFLLWLGRQDVAREHKEQFIQALVEFEDGCEGFYWYRAYFLAAAGIAEFRKCSWADEIISQLLRWSFGYFNVSMQLWVREGCPSTELAMAAFQETARDLALRALIELINTTSDDYTRIEAAVCLSKIDSSHPKVLGTLLQLIRTSPSQNTRRQAASMLEKVGTGSHQEAIAVLAELVDESDDEFIRHGASFSLGKIAPNHPKAGKIAEPTLLLEYVKLGKIDLGNLECIAWLVEEVRASANELYHFALDLQGSHEDGEMESIFERETLVQHNQLVFRCSQALLNLRHITPGHPEAIKVLIDVIHSSVNDYICAEAVRSLGRIGKRTPEAIALLIDLIRNSQNFSIRWRAVQGLWHTETSHEKAIWGLIDVIRTAPDGQIRMEAAQSLGQILQRHPLVSAISVLKDCLPTQICNNKDFALYQECYEVLWRCAQTMPYPAFYKAWHKQYTTSPS